MLLQRYNLRGRGLPNDLVYQIQAIVDYLSRQEEQRQQVRPSGFNIQQEQFITGLLGPFGQAPIGTSTSDPLLEQIGTGDGTVTSVSAASAAGGFNLSGGPITSSGTLTFSVSNAATARGTLGIDDIATKKSNLTAVVAPTVNEDSGDGYAVGSIWIDVALDDAYICCDATVGAAVWKLIT